MLGITLELEADLDSSIPPSSETIIMSLMAESSGDMGPWQLSISSASKFSTNGGDADDVRRREPIPNVFLDSRDQNLSIKNASGMNRIIPHPLTC